jgi:hypothetical protein
MNDVKLLPFRWMEWVAFFVVGFLIMFIIACAIPCRRIENDWPTHPPGADCCNLAAIKNIEERPLPKEDDYGKKKEEAPRGLLFMLKERRFYTFHEGKRYYWNVETKDWSSSDLAKR